MTGGRMSDPTVTTPSVSLEVRPPGGHDLKQVAHVHLQAVTLLESWMGGWRPSLDPIGERPTVLCLVVFSDGVEVDAGRLGGVDQVDGMVAVALLGQVSVGCWVGWARVPSGAVGLGVVVAENRTLATWVADRERPGKPLVN